MDVAVCTMSYNEKVMLPLWINYYGNLFGFKNLYVFDHGSDDGSTENLHHINLIRLPRTPYSDRIRSLLVSDLSKNLLNFHDYFIYTDTDEFLCSDPRSHANLRSYIEDREPEYVTAVGLNLFQCAEEPPIDFSRPILGQRQYAYFLPAMCKTLITRTPIQWGGGFHACDKRQRFDGVFNFHLKQVDRGHALDRQRVLRGVERDRAFAKHQLISDEELENRFSRISSRSRTESFDFTKETQELLASVNETHAGRHLFDKAAERRCSNHLRLIPERFDNVF